MPDVLAKTARVIARRAGAQLAMIPGVAYDHTDPVLATMAEALVQRLEPTGAALLSLERNHSAFAAVVDDASSADPISPAAFQRVVRSLAWDMLGEVWDGSVRFAQGRSHTHGRVA